MSDGLSPSQGSWLRNCFVGNRRRKKEQKSRFERFIFIYSMDAWYMQSVYLSETIILGKGVGGQCAEATRLNRVKRRHCLLHHPASVCRNLLVHTYLFWLLFFIWSDPRDWGWCIILFFWFCLFCLFIDRVIAATFKTAWKKKTGSCQVNLLWFSSVKSVIKGPLLCYFSST